MADLNGYYPEKVREGIFKGVDLRALARRFWALDAMRADGEKPPAIRWRSRRAPSVGGTAWTGSGRVTMRLGPGTVEDAAEVLLHELVHVSCPLGAHHGELFRRRLIACAREAFSLDLSAAELLSLRVGENGIRAYSIDRAIRRAMEEAGVGERLRAEYPAAPPEEPPAPERRAEERTARTAALVAKREAHARGMLAAWERKLAAARRLRSKWARKVRYYERAAAKRGDGSC